MRNDSLRNYESPANEQDARDALLSADAEWLGLFGEAVWSNILHWSRWYYIPLARIEEGGAPLMHSCDGDVILPDLDTCFEGRAAFVEVKAKTQSVFYRRIGKERHGINERNWRHYEKISAEMRRHCAIAILELQNENPAYQLSWSGALLLETLKQLGKPERGQNEYPPKVYWNRKWFREVHHFTAMELFAVANGTRRVDLGKTLGNTLFPFRQVELF